MPSETCEYCGAARKTVLALGVETRLKTCGAVPCLAKDREWSQRIVAEHEARRREDSIGWKRRGGIPEKYVEATTADYRKDPLPAAPRDLLLIGPQGRGKTHLAAAAVDKYRIAGFRWTRPGLLNDEAFRSGEGWLARCPLLVLDDLGSARTDPHAAGLMYEILALREEGLKPTIVTTNLEPKEVAAWDPRTWSRLETYRRIRVDGENRRAAEAQAEAKTRKDVDG